jgi:hypothetical protein
VGILQFLFWVLYSAVNTVLQNQKLLGAGVGGGHARPHKKAEKIFKVNTFRLSF